MKSSGRGVLYLVWGEKIEPVLQRSIASLKAIHPELPIEIARLDAPENSAQSLMEKTEMFERSPFDETLYLDADTIVMGRLDFAFEMARQFGLACCICEAPFARRYAGLADRGDMVEYNCGVLFFTTRAKPVFDAWREIALSLDSSLLHFAGGRKAVMPWNDQAGFAAAVAKCGISPFVLPRNWNFRAYIEHEFYGPLKIWHAYPDPPASVIEIGKYYGSPGAILQHHKL